LPVGTVFEAYSEALTLSKSQEEGADDYHSKQEEEEVGKDQYSQQKVYFTL
jgi:hypothetical protein